MGSILKGFGLHTGKPKGHKPTLFDRHPGQAIVLIAVLMVVLIGFTGLAVDGGELYFLQKDVQNAADAAVLAGLYAICSEPISVNHTLDDVYQAIYFENVITQPIGDNGFYDTDGVWVTDMTDGVDINITYPATPPGAGGMDPNYLIVEITVSKPARLIQLVYQGPLQVTVRAAGKCTPVAEWSQGKALFGIGPCNGGGGEHDSVEFNGSQVVITGGIHGNGGVSMTSGNGSNASNVDGGISGSGNVSTGNVGMTSPSTSTSGTDVVTVPEFWNLDRFRPNGKTGLWAASHNAYFYHNGNITNGNNRWDQFTPDPYNNATGVLLDGIYFVDGNLALANDLQDVDLNGKTFVATGTMSFSLSSENYMVPYGVPQTEAEIKLAGYNVLPLIFTDHPEPDDPPSCDNSTSNNNITIGSKMSFLGVIYGPNAECSFSGSHGVTAQGSIMCYRINLSGSEWHMDYDPDQFPPPPPTVGVTG